MEQTLGAIMRDGTTIRLPYLTTNAKFNQRLYIVNRGGAAMPTSWNFQMRWIRGPGDGAAGDAGSQLPHHDSPSG